MKARILLDTNIWRALADADAGQALLSTSKNNGLEIVIAPAVVYETLAMGDVVVRNRILRMQAAQHWTRLMPDAFTECLEIRNEVRRLHPEWLASDPDLSLFNRHERDWRRKTASGKGYSQQGFWDRVRNHPDSMSKAIIDGRLELARQETQAVDLKGKEKIAKPTLLDGMTARLEGQSPSSAVDAWRWPAFAAFASHIQAQDGAYRDWLVPFFRIDPANMGSEPWTLFWVYEADTLSVPRQWVRWAFSNRQLYRKWTPGTPGDQQLSSYLIDCDYVVSADKAFVDIANVVRAEAPITMARGIRVAGGKEGVAELLDFCSTAIS